MTDLVFEYRGKDLIKPLAALIAGIDAELAAIAAMVATQLPADIADARSPSSMQPRRPTAGENTVRRLDAEALELRVKRREAELWLNEARRTPRYTWTLTMRELANLYPLPKAVAA